MKVSFPSISQPELRRLPARADFNVLDLIRPPEAVHVIRNPFVPAKPAEPGVKIGDTLSLRNPMRLTPQTLSNAVLRSLSGSLSILGDIQAEKDEFAKWLKAREAELKARGIH